MPFTVLEEVMLLSEIGKIRLPLPFRDFLVLIRQAETSIWALTHRPARSKPPHSRPSEIRMTV